MLSLLLLYVAVVMFADVAVADVCCLMYRLPNNRHSTTVLSVGARREACSTLVEAGRREGVGLRLRLLLGHELMAPAPAVVLLALDEVVPPLAPGLRAAPPAWPTRP